MNDSTCRWPECDSTQIKGRQLCQKHYLRAWRAKDFDRPWLALERPPCKWPDCTTVPVSRDYCSVHIRRADRFPDSEEPWVPWAKTPRSGAFEWSKVCIWPSCKEDSEWRDFCVRHYSRAWAVGDFTKPWELRYNTCSVCGVEYCPLQVRSKGRTYCSEPCRQKSKRITHPERERDRRLNRQHAKRSAGLAETITRAQLRARDGDECYLCGEVIDFEIQWPNPQSPSMDHLVPLSKGGLHQIENTAMTHLKCNMRKGVKVATPGEMTCHDSPVMA